ncbi:hypothetical protein B0T13DRAFT_445361 [Neurospora crassa]|nr:hypothetical protein B0T13DRAFT_445361 [Neurospora crassa]
MSIGLLNLYDNDNATADTSIVWIYSSNNGRATADEYTDHYEFLRRPTVPSSPDSKMSIPYSPRASDFSPSTSVAESSAKPWLSCPLCTSLDPLSTRRSSVGTLPLWGQGIHTLCERLIIFPWESSELSEHHPGLRGPLDCEPLDPLALPAAPEENATISDVLHSVIAMHNDLCRLCPMPSPLSLTPATP